MRLQVALAVLSLLASGTAGATAPIALAVSSPDLPAGKLIPDLFTGRDFGCTGGEVSPEIVWRGAPAGTKSVMVTMYDPYRPPQSGWWHWVVIDIPGTADHLPRGAGNPDGPLPAGARMARPDGDAPQPRYYGPCPDKGDPAHHYVITVKALDIARIDLPDTATTADYDYATVGHVLAEGRIVRDYRRP
ncbi:PEBP family protein [Novosphingobium nitrogenifigens DSM 19370]|uniref:PEBP family protein n=1 Tax=Novosphingobium nitrogenifigens DSM 19370 TaxID=983920 RepID=F1ZAV2_9SPHN|nr:YbhB/YbcL family Raf kinase inhibitor-like protein [Novosphingobium nitrogenifigens]EGD58270.1 PEBP family protein [Novosphingobium nitrogenifigens DSM 19370]